MRRRTRVGGGEMRGNLICIVNYQLRFVGNAYNDGLGIEGKLRENMDYAHHRNGKMCLTCIT